MKKYKLAPLTKCDPEKIVPRDNEERLIAFLLSLALAFNDLKGLLLLKEDLQAHRPDKAEVSGRAGQYHGVELQLHRYIFALIHELLALIAEYEDVARGAAIRGWLKQAHSTVKKKWKALVTAATGGKGTDDRQFLNALLRIRNNAVSHYYQPKQLVRGFRLHYFESESAPENEHAYVSLGQSMPETRFYYADAAVQRAVAEMMRDLGETVFAHRMLRLASDVNHALEYLLRRHAMEARR